MDYYETEHAHEEFEKVIKAYLRLKNINIDDEDIKFFVKIYLAFYETY